MSYNLNEIFNDKDLFIKGGKYGKALECQKPDYSPSSDSHYSSPPIN